jgi:hypothetical protein
MPKMEHGGSAHATHIITILSLFFFFFCVLFPLSSVLCS